MSRMETIIFVEPVSQKWRVTLRNKESGEIIAECPHERDHATEAGAKRCGIGVMMRHRQQHTA